MLLSWFSAVAVFALSAVPVFAQTQAVGQASTLWRTIQLVAFVGVILCVAGVTYGLVLWRNGSQNNDIIVMERGRRNTAIFGVLLIVFVVLLIISFIVIRRQTQIAPQALTTLQPVGRSGLDTRNALLLVEALPIGPVPLRNVAVRLLFNQPVPQTGVEQNISVVSKKDGQPVVGAWTVSDEVATFQPNTACPEPNARLRCFDANTEYDIQIKTGLASVDGDPFRCSQPSAQCSFSFKTGDKVDAIPPSVDMTQPFPSASVPAESSVTVEALGKDDVSVAGIEFYADGQRVAVVPVTGGDIVTEFRGSSAWVTAGLLIDSEHRLSAKVVDLAGLSGTSAPIAVKISPAHCFDGAKNEDEVQLDCGGSCRACQGQACTSNADCASGLCVGGLCQDYPVIQEVIDSNGAPGNYITIRGQNFGAQPGRVVFLGLPQAEDDVVADFPACEGIWSPTQVIVRVPAGAHTGSLRLETAGKLYDTTEDDKGVRFVFEVNDVTRPGICSVTPNAQQIGEKVRLQGVGFGASVADVVFGSLKAGRIGAWTTSSISDVVVPSAEPSLVGVRVTVNGEKSNPYYIRITESPTLPHVDSISPDRGPVGQIFSIDGKNLGKSPLVKFLNPRTGEVVLADTRLPDACQRLKNQQLRAFRVPRVETGVYEVIVETDAGRSNSVSFTVTQSGRLPGLCAITPDNGPLGTVIVLYGEGFGVNKGGVRFAPRLDVSNVTSWNDGTIRLAVPPGTQTGPVQVIAATGELSNALPFRVGSCSPDTCGAGLQCCSNGACQAAGTCFEVVPVCTYTWLFGTGKDLGGIPRVIEESTCKNNTQSPSPYAGTLDACLNASVSARFTHDMDDRTLNGNNIELRKCNTGSVLAGSSCQTVISLTNFMMINSGQGGEGFSAQPTSPLEPDTWYQVTISNKVTASNGNALAQPYRWNFKTQQNTGNCAVDHVEVTPANATLKQLGKQQQYTGVATAINCNILNSSSYSWRWLSQSTAKATVLSTTEPTTKATAVGPTDPGPAVSIYGAIPEFSKEDNGQLRITLEPPVVVDKWPNCSSACVNAAMGAKFNQNMQEDSVTAASNIQLYECGDEACSRAQQKNIGVTSISYNRVDFSVYFLPKLSIFKAGAKYRVVLLGMRSSGGIPLSGLNYDANGDGSIDSYSWLFSVRQDGNLCKVEKVDVAPPAVQSYLMKEDFDYFALPTAPADACNKYGQILRGDSYDWGWASANSGIASISQLDRLPPPGLKDPEQVGTSQGEGETTITAGTGGISGKGTFSVACGYQQDIQCPAPATPDTYGVGNDSCCYPRPSIVGSNPRDGATEVCTTLSIEVQYDQPMDEQSLISNLYLERNNGAAPCEKTQANLWDKAKDRLSLLWSWIIPASNAQTENWCQVQASVSVSTNETGTIARVTPKEELAQSHQYRVRAVGDQDLGDGTAQGIRNRANVPQKGDFVRVFSTGKAQCSLDYVEVTVTPPGKPGSFDVAFCAGRNDCPADADATLEGNQHGFEATGRDRSGYVVPAKFSWSIEGDDIAALNGNEGPKIEATIKPLNGQANITVSGVAESPSKGIVSRSVTLYVFLCENPWPSLADFPYVDKSFNFDIFYCRDAGEPGTQDDLPPLSSPVTDKNVGGVLSESLFIIK